MFHTQTTGHMTTCISSRACRNPWYQKQGCQKALLISKGHGKAIPAQRFLCCRPSVGSTADCEHCQPASRCPSTVCERRWLHSNRRTQQMTVHLDSCARSRNSCTEQKMTFRPDFMPLCHDTTCMVDVSKKGAALGHTSNAGSAVGCPLQAVDAVICFASKTSQIFGKCGYAVLGPAHFHASFESPAQPLCSQAGMQSSTFVAMHIEPLSCVRGIRRVQAYAKPWSEHLECVHVLQVPCHILLLSDKQFEGCARGTESPV